MPRLKYKLDDLLKRVRVREEIRSISNPQFYVFSGLGAEGKWNETSPVDRNNWNLTDEDMKDIEAALKTKNVFTSQMVVTNETSLEQANDSLKRMKKGDCSKFNHLPQFLREYYGKKSLIELFGTDKEIPELNDEIKKKLDKFLVRPEFRFALTRLIERNAKDPAGNSMVDRLLEYDKYLNHKMMTGLIDPISPKNIENINKKFPKEKAEQLIRDNKEKQVFLAKTLFMAQLGRIDIITGEGENKVTEPFEGSVTELFSHSGRVMFTLPPGEEESQDKIFDSWRKNAVDSGVLKLGRFASHDTLRRHVDDNGEMVKPAEEIRYKWKEQLKSGQLNKKVTTYTHNSGMNIPLGGLGRKFNGKDCVDGEGNFGHLYMKSKQGDKNSCGNLLIGFENAAPKKESCIGQLHNFKAISHDMSSFFSNKVTIGKVIGGREIDLSHLTADEFAETMEKFEAGYRQLVKDAEYTDTARKELKAINSKICGKHMTAIELAAVMTTIGFNKKEAIRITEAGRSVKDAAYGADRYPIEMQKITDPAAVSERYFNPDMKAAMDEVKRMSAYVDDMRRQWNQMSSHTLFDAWNSDEFKAMDKALGKYLKAFDNIMAGKTVDGKAFRPRQDHLDPEEYNKLRTLEQNMVKAGKKYHNEKMKQKDGGFDKHKTDQARDRDAMSIMISKFSLDARNEVRAANNDIQNMNKKEQKAMNKMLNKEARTKLNNRVKQQMGR